MRVSQRLVNAQSILEQLLLDHSHSTAPFRGGLDLSSRRLIEADVVFLGTLEVWYEMHAFKVDGDPDHIHFDIQLASDGPLPTGTLLSVFYGVTSLQVALSSVGAGHWSLREDEVIDRKSQTVRGPVKIELMA